MLFKMTSYLMRTIITFIWLRGHEFRKYVNCEGVVGVEMVGLSKESPTMFR